MHKAKLSNILLKERIKGKENFIIMATEPYQYEGEIVLLGVNVRKFPEGKGSNRPRSAIYVNKNLLATYLDHLRNQDRTVVQLIMGSTVLILVSLYLDIRRDVDKKDFFKK
jgi:hypothetical protein